MNGYRWLTLLLGPFPIVLGSMSLSHWLRSPHEVAPLSGNHVVVRGQDEVSSPERVLSLHMRAAPSSADGASQDDARLEDACRESAEQLAGQLGPGCRVIVRSPFVIGGDFPEAELERHYQRTIGPAALRR